jgi:hypothetical protein
MPSEQHPAGSETRLAGRKHLESRFIAYDYGARVCVPGGNRRRCRHHGGGVPINCTEHHRRPSSNDSPQWLGHPPLRPEGIELSQVVLMSVPDHQSTAARQGDGDRKQLWIVKVPKISPDGGHQAQASERPLNKPGGATARYRPKWNE